MPSLLNMMEDHAYYAGLEIKELKKEIETLKAEVNRLKAIMETAASNPNVPEIIRQYLRGQI